MTPKKIYTNKKFLIQKLINRIKQKLSMNKFEYVVCPLCARNRVIQLTKDTNKSKRLKFSFFDIYKSNFLQVRQQHPREKGGKSKGFTIIPE